MHFCVRSGGGSQEELYFMNPLVCKKAANKNSNCLYVTCTHMRLCHTTHSAQTDKGQEKKTAQNVLCDQNVPEYLEETGHLGS